MGKKGKMDGDGAVCGGYGVLGSAVAGEGAFELGDLFALGELAGGEHFPDGVLFFLAQ